jgi:hypothetical protein
MAEWISANQVTALLIVIAVVAVLVGLGVYEIRHRSTQFVSGVAKENAAQTVLHKFEHAFHFDKPVKDLGVTVTGGVGGNGGGGSGGSSDAGMWVYPGKAGSPQPTTDALRGAALKNEAARAAAGPKAAPAVGAGPYAMPASEPMVQVAQIKLEIPTDAVGPLEAFDALMKAGKDFAAYYHITKREADALIARKLGQGELNASEVVPAMAGLANKYGAPAGYAGSLAESLRERV